MSVDFHSPPKRSISRQRACLVLFHVRKFHLCPCWLFLAISLLSAFHVFHAVVVYSEWHRDRQRAKRNERFSGRNTNYLCVNGVSMRTTNFFLPPARMKGISSTFQISSTSHTTKRRGSNGQKNPYSVFAVSVRARIGKVLKIDIKIQYTKPTKHHFHHTQTFHRLIILTQSILWGIPYAQSFVCFTKLSSIWLLSRNTKYTTEKKQASHSNSNGSIEIRSDSEWKSYERCERNWICDACGLKAAIIMMLTTCNRIPIIVRTLVSVGRTNIGC